MKTNAKQTSHVRWLIRRDIPAVLESERDSFQSPGDEAEFTVRLRQRNCIGMVAVDECDVPRAFFFYLMHPTKIELINLAVDPLFRAEGIGTACIDKLKSKLSPHRRNRIVVDVSEKNLQAHLFFKACGFRAVSVLQNQFTTDEACYRFVHRHGGEG